jgi:hypothetical protein
MEDGVFIKSSKLRMAFTIATLGFSGGNQEGDL